MSPGEAIYLFCCALAEPLPSSLELEGLDDGRPVRRQRHRDLAAIVAEVSLDEFTGPEVETRLRDLAWLAPRALRHEQVIEQVAQYSPVFPTRFGTIFSTREALDAMLARHHDVIRSFLDRTAGTEEWGLKGFLDRGKAQAQWVEEQLATGAAPLSSSPGMRYMQERRLRAEAEVGVSRWLGETSARLEEALAPHALRMTERKLIAAGSAEIPAEMVLNWAFLVPRTGVEALRAAGEDLARALVDWGFGFEFVGPFPPYSFTPALDEPPP